jgi:hypothetical protein
MNWLPPIRMSQSRPPKGLPRHTKQWTSRISAPSLPTYSAASTKAMQQTYFAASKGAADFNLHLLDIAQANMNAAFDFARQLARVTSPSEFFECRPRTCASRSKG